MATDQLTDAEKQAEFDEQWKQVMAGLDRAVAWVKAHKNELRWGFSFFLDQKTGIRIHIASIFTFDQERDKKLAAIKKLFGGKTAKRTVTPEGDHRFRLVNPDLNLTFTWEIYRKVTRTPRPQTEEVTI